MLRITAMSNYQCFRWLWRFDSEYKWSWLYYYLRGSDLQLDVFIAIYDTGNIKKFYGKEIT